MLKAFSLKRLFLVYSLPLTLILCLLSGFDAFRQPDLFFLDRAFQWRGPREPRPELAIVAITQQDFERGAPRWPWPRSLMARLIDQVSSHGPAPQPLPDRQTTIAPHFFVGTAIVGGAPAPDGTVITAWVEGFSEPVREAVVAGGSYNLKVFQFGKASFADRTITFKIGESTANETGVWQSFGADVVDLTVEG